MIATARIKKALLDANGNMSRAARLLGCTRKTIHNRCEEYPELKQITIDGRESLLDNAEDKLAEAVDEGKPWAVAMVIAKLGKTRGYSERQEVSGADNGPIEIIIKRKPE